MHEYSGLTSQKAKELIKVYGYNRLEEKRQFEDFYLLIEQFKNPYLVLLIAVSTLSLFLGETVDAITILLIILFSVFISFWQEKKAKDVVETLISKVKTYATVIRDGKQKEIPLEEVVPGDVVLLTAGDIVPADCKLMESKDLFVDESIITGESYPVEKEKGHFLYMGTHVVSGFGVAIVIKTGKNSEYGKVVERIKLGKAKTAFEKGLENFGYMLLYTASVMVLVVFAVNAYHHKGVIQSLLFALSIGIGITPVLLPGILTISLSFGAKRLASFGVIVKKLPSLHNFGSMTLLCSDKTGTLTEGKVKVHAFIDLQDRDSQEVKLFSYLNAYFQTGYKNPIDEAIKEHPVSIEGYNKLDEIPYDFNRKRLSVLVEYHGKRIMITKGAFNKVLEICSHAKIKDEVYPIDKVEKDIEELYRYYSSHGYRVLALSYKEMNQSSISHQDERDMTLLGLLLLHDPPKREAKESIKKLRRLGVELKIITGDNKLVARHVAQELGIHGEIMDGRDLEGVSPDALPELVKRVSIFAELSPLQKESVILALKKAGYVVGYVGDGINDIAAMRASDVAISVENAVEVVKEASDIVLQTTDLNKIADSVVEGRKTFTNTMKYLFVQTSSNFGNMFSMSGFSFLVSFIPLLPQQVLLLNTLADLVFLSIPFDKTDNRDVKRPKRWDVKDIARFMVVFGVISSIFDYLTLFLVYFLLTRSIEDFRSAWFLTSILTQSFVLLVLRTPKAFYRSRPSNYLLFSILGVSIISLLLPYTPLRIPLELKPLSLPLYLLVCVIVVFYLLLVEVVKRRFYIVNRISLF